MLKDVAFGQYYPTNSPVHRMDPRVKLVLMLFFVVLIFFVETFVGYLVYAALVIAVTLISKVKFRTLFRSLKGILILMVFICIINVFFYGGEGVLWQGKYLSVTVDSLLHAGKMCLRIVLLVTGPALLTFTTTPMQLTDAFESLLSPLKVIRFPVRDLAVIMSIALRMIPTLMEETDRIMMAQKARGASIDHGNPLRRIKALVPVLVPLFVGAFRRAEELANALDARCYNATPNRTRYHVLKVRGRDVAGILLMAAWGALVILGIPSVLWNFDTMVFEAIVALV